MGQPESPTYIAALCDIYARIETLGYEKSEYVR
jgi:hypothetical protein